MLMALNRQMLHNSLLKVQQHIISTSSNKLVVAPTTITPNNVSVHTLRRSSSFQQQCCTSDTEDDILKKNPYYTAYSEKLQALKNKDVDAYHKLLKHLSQEKQKTDNINATDKTSTVFHSNSTTNEIQAKPNRRPSQSLIKPKTLEQVMNMNLLRDQSWRDISEIWLAYHKTRDVTLSAVIPLSQFDKFYQKSIKYPMFVLPLPRNNTGYEFMFAQFQHYQQDSISNCTVHITPLISYQKFNENAPECMTIEYYTDLLNNAIVDNKNTNDESCVLMRATYDGKLLSPVEAACLVNQLRIFYGMDSCSTEKERLLKLFNKGDTTFMYSDVIALVETLSIS